MDLRESRLTEMIETNDRSKWLSYNNHNIKRFTEDEIRRITSNYRAIIGKGGFGEVYKGVLKDGSTVAVKKFVRNVEENFAKELKVHSEINHKNVVRLIGYCAEQNALMIVTEYISKGNLSDVLHHDCIPIVLDIRLRIAVECSEALGYMHSKMYTQVIHGDIKPANILLDDNFNAKISDFGISRLVNTEATLFTEHVIGSRDYMDPLFAHYGRVTSKSDVYSFGIVLVELITKKKATLRNGEIGIVECFTQALATGIRRVRELFDVEISSQNNMKVLEGVAKLAGECLRMQMDRRPEMLDVAERLRALWKTQVQGKQTLTIFPWGWRNKLASQNNGQTFRVSGVHVPQSSPAAKNNGQSSGASGVHVPQPLPVAQNNGQSLSASGVHVPQHLPAAQNNRQSSSVSRVHVPQVLPAAQNDRQSSSASGVHVPQHLPAAQNNGQSSSVSRVHVPQALPAAQNDVQSYSVSGIHVPQPLRADQNNGQSSGASGVHVLQPLIFNLCRQFSLEEMKSVTRNFDKSHLVGVGKSSKVYYGMIDGGATKVAIKRRDRVEQDVNKSHAYTDSRSIEAAIERRGRIEQDVNKFHAGIAAVAKLRHHNLVSLVGYCRENNEMILIYDYMACVTLCWRLREPCRFNTKEPPLTWRQRLDVCIGAARALHYLHKCSSIHHCLTSKDILLDEGLVAKVSLPHVASIQQDIISRGYHDTELYPTQRTNVFKFGIVLFEVLCAQAVRDLTLPKNQDHFIRCVLHCKEKGNLDQLVDPYLNRKIAPRCFNKFVDTAAKCINNHPSMREVLQDLEMCLAEESGGLGDGTSDDDGTDRTTSAEPGDIPFR